MGNPTIPPQAHFDKIAPPPAPPPQPGEVRGCLRCARCDGLVKMPSTSGYDALCAWRGPWDRPLEGCDRWAPRDGVPLPAPVDLRPSPLLQANGGRKRSTRRGRRGL